jgi:hypothetical protein
MIRTKQRLMFGVCLLCTGLVVLFFVIDSAWYNQPLADTAGTTLFRQPGLHFTVECSHDLLGFSPGDVFTFYEYGTRVPV